MRKVLLLVIFLLTLLPFFDIVGGSRASAQRMAYEKGSYWLPDVDVTGKSKKCELCGEVLDSDFPELHECTKAQCSICKEVMEKDYLENHMQLVHQQSSGKVEPGMCATCGKYVTDWDSHSILFYMS